MSGFLSALVIVAASMLIWKGQRLVKVHTLTQPLIISSDRSDKVLHTLPPGTTLYFEESFPEGFTRYKVYVNVDRMPLTLRDLTDPTEIDPLEARAFDKEALNRALREYPLTRKELAAVLQSPHLTKEEIKEVFLQYLENTK
ncbi:hypothetical protein [Massilia suwonensis]|uniref:Uncharacterized protein n=1 Tax=Massilia suwonensis TaxID=648895 RepID=A0ABW0MEI5_9BURK